MVWHKCVCGYVVAHVVYAFGFAVNKGKCSAQISSRRRLLSLVVVALTASCMSYQWQWYLWWQQQHIHIYYQQSAHWCRWHKGNKTPIKKVHVLGCYFATFLFTAIDSVNVACVFFFPHFCISAFLCWEPGTTASNATNHKNVSERQGSSRQVAKSPSDTQHRRQQNASWRVLSYCACAAANANAC